MKRFIFLAAITFMVIGSLFAQSANTETNNRANNRRGAPQSITVEGTLQLHNGSISMESGGNRYYIPMLFRYTGFIDGLKEGARVSIEGIPNRNIIHPTKVTVAGKAYDFPALGRGLGTTGMGPGRGPGPGGYGPGPGRGYGQGGYGQRWQYGPRGGYGFGQNRNWHHKR
jgi:hypothetical protein